MKVMQTASLQLGSVATQGKSDLGSASQNRPAERKAVMGGMITALAVAAHVRRRTNISSAGQRSI